MKYFVFSFVILIAIAYCNADSSCEATDGDEGLSQIFDALLERLPILDLGLILGSALSENPGVKEALNILKTDDYKKVVDFVKKSPEYQKIKEYACKELHFDIPFWYNLIMDLISIGPPKLSFLVDYHKENGASGLAGLFKDLEDALDFNDLAEFAKELINTNEYAKKAYELFKSDNFKKLVKDVEALPEFQNILNKLRTLGAPVDRIFNFLKKTFSWN